MLIKLLSSSHLPFNNPRTERLLCLETHLRKKSDGSMALRNYIEQLEDEGIAIPTRRTLNEDLKRYEMFCDDIQYGGESKLLSLDSSATQDAVAWLMGRAWLDSPLRPRLSSSCIRCLLLAKELQAEVDFPYNPLRKSGEPWIPKMMRGIPLQLIPGTDSSYMQLQLDWGGRSNINLARVQKYVSFTGNKTQDYVPLQEEQVALITVESSDVFLLKRLQGQFPNFVIEKEKQRVTLKVKKSLALMTRDMLKAHLERTQTSDRRIFSEQEIDNNLESKLFTKNLNLKLQYFE